MKKQIIAIIGIALLLNACEKNPDSSEIKWTITPKIGQDEVKLSTYYKLNSTDSILVDRLDFYTQTMKVNDNTVLKELNFFSLGKSNVAITQSISNTPFALAKLSFVVGLDSAANASNPNQYSDTHPLSSQNNMYWPGWGSYVYMKIEGKIKTPDSIISIAFHTGGTYSANVTLVKSLQIASGTSKNLSIILNVDKLIIPDVGSAMNYKGNEKSSHSDPSEAAITEKFVTNLSKAFSISE